jgi:hypothetical protein
MSDYPEFLTWDAFDRTKSGPESGVSVPELRSRIGRLSLLFHNVDAYSSIALFAAREINQTEQDEDLLTGSPQDLRVPSDRFWMATFALVTATAEVSMTLWPPKPLHRKGESGTQYVERERRWRERAADVRAWLAIGDESVLANRDLRNGWIHIDERLHTLIDGSNYQFADLHYDSPGMLGIPRTSQYRGFDPVARTFIFRETDVPLLPLVQELNTVNERSKALRRSPQRHAERVNETGHVWESG